MSTQFHKGDKVKVTVYGVEKTGVVSREPTSEIIWVGMDPNGRERWFHMDSLSTIGSIERIAA